MTNSKKFQMAAGLAALALAASACGGVADQSGGSSGDTVELRATNLLPPNGAMSDTIQWFMDELEERTGGEVETEVVYGGGLLSGTDTLPGMKQGRAEAGNVVPAYFPAEMPLNNLIAVSTNSDQATRLRALQDLADTNEAFAAELSDNDLVPIGFLPNASSTVAFNKKISSLEDVEGAKLRIPSQPLSVVWEELGAEPVFMASEEVYEAVERGIVDGVTFPFDTQVANGITDVADYLAADVGQSGGSIFAINQKAYDGLSDEAKEVIEELKGEWYAKADELLTKYESEACADFLDGGGTVVQWSDEDREAMAEANTRLSSQVWKDEIEGAVGAEAADDVWDAYQAALEEHEGESDYSDGLLTCGQ